MPDRPRPTQVVTLDQPRDISHDLAPWLRTVGRVRTRAALERTPGFAEARSRIADVCYGVAYGQPARPAPRPPRRFLRVVAWNVERGSRLDGIIAWLHAGDRSRAVDLLLLNEVDVGMARSGNRDAARELGEALGFEWVFGASYLCLPPVAGADNVRGVAGCAVLSRYPIARAENFSMAITRDKLPSSEPRLGHKKALWAEVRTPLGSLALASVHLDSVASPAQRAAQMRDVVDTLRARGVASRALIGGDFNTTTWDLKSTWRLLANLGRKLARGGFPHAMHAYVHPDQLYERATFRVLEEGGFAYKQFNREAAGSLRYMVGDAHSQGKVLEHLPSVVVDILRYKLRPWNGVAPVKVDWFAGSGVRALGDGDVVDDDGRASEAPRVIDSPAWEGRRLSDHDPIQVDIAL
jgi:endonuclease/exonuclease/phosphatase family metal-dependent hydrolase